MVKTPLLISVVVALALFTAACGDDDDTGSADDSAVVDDDTDSGDDSAAADEGPDEALPGLPGEDEEADMVDDEDLDLTTEDIPPLVQPDDAEDYIGLTTEDAIAKADDDNRIWRIVREDDEDFPRTDDVVEGRINFEIDDGEVTAAEYG